MEVKINLNEKVKFKLSEHGKKIYRHRYDGYGVKYDREPKLDNDGYMSMQLWTFMRTFGGHMVLGMPGVVQPLEIIYEIDGMVQNVTELERPKGEWVAIPNEIVGQGEVVTDGYIWQCTNCSDAKERNNPDMNFCPNCGADMRGEEDD